MKSLKDLLLSSMFVVMTAALLVACGDKAEDGGSDATEGNAVTDVVETGTETIDAAQDIKDEAEDDEWFPDDVVSPASAANQ